MLDQLYARPGFLLRRAHQLSVAIFEKSCQTLQLTPSQYAVLVVLQERPLAHQNQLALALGMNKVTISQTVKALTERMLIQREALGQDKRHKAMQLTPQGLHLLRESQACTDQAFGLFMQPLNAAEQTQLLDLLQKVTRELEPHAKAPWVLETAAEPHPQKPNH